jgi:hypothetical protein
MTQAGVAKAGQTGMCGQDDRPLGHPREAGHQPDELLHLGATDLAASEHVGHRVDGDLHGLDVAGHLVEPAVGCSGLDNTALAGGSKDRAVELAE